MREITEEKKVKSTPPLINALFTALSVVIASCFTVFIVYEMIITMDKTINKEEIAQGRAELAEWIEGYDIVDVQYDVQHLEYTVIIVRMNNGVEESKEFSADYFKLNLDHESPDDKYHIIEYDDAYIIYEPATYYDNLIRSESHSN